MMNNMLQPVNDYLNRKEKDSLVIRAILQFRSNIYQGKEGFVWD